MSFEADLNIGGDNNYYLASNTKLSNYYVGLHEADCGTYTKFLIDGVVMDATVSNEKVSRAVVHMIYVVPREKDEIVYIHNPSNSAVYMTEAKVLSGLKYIHRLVSPSGNTESINLEVGVFESPFELYKDINIVSYRVLKEIVPKGMYGDVFIFYGGYKNFNGVFSEALAVETCASIKKLVDECRVLKYKPGTTMEGGQPYGLAVYDEQGKAKYKVINSPTFHAGDFYEGTEGISYLYANAADNPFPSLLGFSSSKTNIATKVIGAPYFPAPPSIKGGHPTGYDPQRVYYCKLTRTTVAVSYVAGEGLALPNNVTYSGGSPYPLVTYDNETTTVNDTIYKAQDTLEGKFIFNYAERFQMLYMDCTEHL